MLLFEQENNLLNIKVLGEGTFGEVKLLVNKENGEACAMKEINLDSQPEAEETVKKEICVHKLLKHKNIVQCYGSRQDIDLSILMINRCCIMICQRSIFLHLDELILQ